MAKRRAKGDVCERCRWQMKRAKRSGSNKEYRKRCKDRIQYAGTQQRWVHPRHLHPCHKQGAGTGSGEDGKSVKTGTLTQKCRNRVDSKKLFTRHFF